MIPIPYEKFIDTIKLKTIYDENKSIIRKSFNVSHIGLMVFSTYSEVRKMYDE